MNEETARIIWEAMTQEQRDALVEAFQNAAQKIAELANKLADMMGVIFVDGEIVFDKPRRRYKPVKNTLPHYSNVTRRVLPRARSCC